MRRCVHIIVALIAVFLLVRPLDCFSSGKFDKKAEDCCKKGKCSPSNSDECCRATVPDGSQQVVVQATDHSAPILHIVKTEVISTTFESCATALLLEIQQPPGPSPDLRLNIPLLI